MPNEKNNILVVDDEEDAVDILKWYLSRKGYCVSGALSGEEALRILEKDRVDLVFLDLRLPGLQGEEVARIIKDRYPQVKIIVVSAYPEEGRLLAKGADLDAVLTKPVALQELYNRLLKTLDKDESLAMSLKSNQGLMARVLLIKAKLFFLEPSVENYDLLENHFKSLKEKGENYDLGQAKTIDEGIKKLRLCPTDILVVNTASLKEGVLATLSGITEEAALYKEIIVYHAENKQVFLDSSGVLSRLTKAVQMACLKNALLEIKWVEI